VITVCLVVYKIRHPLSRRGQTPEAPHSWQVRGHAQRCRWWRRSVAVWNRDREEASTTPPPSASGIQTALGSMHVVQTRQSQDLYRSRQSAGPLPGRLSLTPGMNHGEGRGLCLMP
jgi:hypothetical protein